jgi:hypothetical protein
MFNPNGASDSQVVIERPQPETEVIGIYALMLQATPVMTR